MVDRRSRRCRQAANIHTVKNMGNKGTDRTERCPVHRFTINPVVEWRGFFHNAAEFGHFSPGNDTGILWDSEEVELGGGGEGANGRLVGFARQCVQCRCILQLLYERYSSSPFPPFCWKSGRISTRI